MSEKMDGVRAYWNGKKMISKHGKKIFCPDWYTLEFPTHVSLDGELWLDRGTFELLNAILNSKGNSDISWKNIHFVVFDLPSSSEPYEIRMREIENLNLPKHVSIADVEKCRGKDHLHERLGFILENGGEGLMVNKPNSLYVTIRTDLLLKVKVCEQI
jgi:DNA ligase-1